MSIKPLNKWNLLYFNAHSICNKFDNISAEIFALRTRIVCITETLLSYSTANSATYRLDGYTAHSNVRYNMIGGGCMIYVDSNYSTIQLTSAVTANNTFNIFAVLLGRR